MTTQQQLRSRTIYDMPIRRSTPQVQEQQYLSEEEMQRLAEEQKRIEALKQNEQLDSEISKVQQKYNEAVKRYNETSGSESQTWDERKNLYDQQLSYLTEARQYTTGDYDYNSIISSAYQSAMDKINNWRLQKKETDDYIKQGYKPVYYNNNPNSALIGYEKTITSPTQTKQVYVDELGQPISYLPPEQRTQYKDAMGQPISYLPPEQRIKTTKTYLDVQPQSNVIQSFSKTILPPKENRLKTVVYSPIRTLNFIGDIAQESYLKSQYGLKRMGVIDVVEKPIQSSEAVKFGVESIPYFTSTAPIFLTSSGTYNILEGSTVQEKAIGGVELGFAVLGGVFAVKGLKQKKELKLVEEAPSTIISKVKIKPKNIQATLTDEAFMKLTRKQIDFFNTRKLINTKGTYDPLRIVNVVEPFKDISRTRITAIRRFRNLEIYGETPKPEVLKYFDKITPKELPTYELDLFEANRIINLRKTRSRNVIPQAKPEVLRLYDKEPSKLIQFELIPKKTLPEPKPEALKLFDKEPSKLIQFEIIPKKTLPEPKPEALKLFDKPVKSDIVVDFGNRNTINRIRSGADKLVGIDITTGKIITKKPPMKSKPDVLRLFDNDFRTPEQKAIDILLDAKPIDLFKKSIVKVQKITTPKTKLPKLKNLQIKTDRKTLDLFNKPSKQFREVKTGKGTSQLIEMKPIVEPKVETEELLKPLRKAKNRYIFDEEPVIEEPYKRFIEPSKYAGKGTYERTQVENMFDLKPTSAGVISDYLMVNKNQISITQPKQKAISLTGTIQKSEMVIGNIQATKTFQESLPASKQQNLLKQLQKIKQKDIVKQSQTSKQVLKSLLSDITKQKLIQKTKQSQKLIQKTKLTKKVKQVFSGNIPVKETVDSKNLDKILEVFARKEGTDIKVGESETVFLAKKLLEKELRGTLRASGFITEKATGRKLNIREVGLGYGFRPSKKESFRIVQRKSLRLGTGGETKEIQFAKKNKRGNRLWV